MAEAEDTPKEEMPSGKDGNDPPDKAGGNDDAAKVPTEGAPNATSDEPSEVPSKAGGDTVDKDDGKADAKGSANVGGKKKAKGGMTSKSSLKKYTDSTMSTLSETSSSSLAIKRRHSDYEKYTRGPKYQNTYRLDSKKPFKPQEVSKVIQTIVEKEISDYPQYDCLRAAKLIQTIAAEVRSTVRTFNYDRYKICVIVFLSEKKLQGFQAAFRALWDSDRDGWASYEHQCRTYLLKCVCYGLYHD